MSGAGALKVSDQIAAAIREADIAAVELAPAERASVLAIILESLHVDVLRTPWDDASAPGGVRRADGWSLIPQYVGSRTCLLITDDAERVWQLRDGGELLRLLGETPGFEFYVCDPSATYLLCHNDHDYLIGWGAAVTWVASLPDDGATGC